jgi:serine/threonine protein kinase
MTDRIGQQFGQYRLSRFLGQGSFGEVYLGEHLSNHTLAAVKLLQTHLTAEDLKEFINEASAMFRLQHPHIVRLLDFGISPANTPFLVMAYAANSTLRKLHPKGTRLHLQSIVAYVSPIASALQHAHDQRLIHRDVKPENILLGPNNEVWLSDFGITSVAHSTRSLDTEKPAGTVPYMAPEQLRGKARPASDQYALGIIVYEWLCGERPFSGTATEIAMQHLLEPPPSLREKVSTISPEVEQVVMRALTKDPAQRFHTILEFAEALEKAVKQFHLKLLLTLPTKEGETIELVDWVWGNHYLLVAYEKTIKIIDVLNGTPVFSANRHLFELGVFWNRANCTGNFDEKALAFVVDGPHQSLIDTNTGKEIASFPFDSWMIGEGSDWYQLKVFSQSSEGKEITALASALIKSDPGWSDFDASMQHLQAHVGFIPNSITSPRAQREGYHGSRICYCPPQWQYIAVARVNERQRIYQIEVYQVIGQ